MTEALPRVRDWRTRLIAWSNAQIGRPFIWGETDCAALVRASLQECFGQDVVPGVPTWQSKREAIRVLKAHEPVKILEALGAVKTTVGFARAGDIVRANETDVVGGIALGVWVDGGCLVTSVERGVVFIRAASMPRDGVVYSLWEILADG